MKTKETYQPKVLFAGSVLLTLILLLSFNVDASPPGGYGYFHASFGVGTSYAVPVVSYATRIQMFAYPSVNIGYTSVYDPYYYPDYGYPSYGPYYGGGGYYYSSGYGSFSVSFSFGYPYYYPVYYTPVVYYPPVYYQPVYYSPVWYGYSPAWYSYRPAYCYPYRYPYHYHYPPAHIWSDAGGNGSNGHTVYHKDNGWHHGYDRSQHNGYNGTYHHTQRGNSHDPSSGGNGRGDHHGNGHGQGNPANRGSHGIQRYGDPATVQARTNSHVSQRNLVRRSPGSSRYVTGHAVPASRRGTTVQTRRPSSSRSVQYYRGNSSITRKITSSSATHRTVTASHRSTPAVAHRTGTVRNTSRSYTPAVRKSAAPAVTRSSYPSVRRINSGTAAPHRITPVRRTVPGRR